MSILRRTSPTPRRSPRDISRAKFDAARQRVEDCLRTLEVQFKRIAQIQGVGSGSASVIETITEARNVDNGRAKG